MILGPVEGESLSSSKVPTVPPSATSISSSGPKFPSLPSIQASSSPFERLLLAPFLILAMSLLLGQADLCGESLRALERVVAVDLFGDQSPKIVGSRPGGGSQSEVRRDFPESRDVIRASER